MKSNTYILFYRNSFKLIVLFVLVILTVIYTIPWTVRNSLEKEYSGIDFHGYWYAGHFIRQGVNSFAAVLNDPNPNYWDPRIPGSGDPYRQGGAENSLELPIYYLDGYVARSHPIAQTLIVVPAVTAPLNLMLGLFSWLSWPTARMIWMMLNISFAASIPWLALRIVAQKVSLSLVDKFIFAFAFYNFYGLRQTIVVGQQTLVCLLLLILALLFKDNWIISGLLLGFGISKYSVGLSVFIYFSCKKKYRTVLVSILVQAIAIILIMPFKLGSPINTLSAYFKGITVNYSQNGVHLPARFPDDQLQGNLLLLLILAIVIFVLARQYYSLKVVKFKGNIMGIKELNLITLAIFLTTYHRVHDMPFMIFFLLFLITSIVESQSFPSSRMALITLLSTSMLIIIFLIYPTIIARAGINNLSWNTVEAVSSISLVLMFALSIWLQIKLFPYPNSLQNRN